MSRLGVLVNPAAGGGRGARTGRAAVEALRARGHDVRTVATVAPEPVRARALVDGDPAPQVRAVPRPPARPDPDDLDDLDDLDALVVVGGDGTVHAGVALTAGTDLPLGIVPAGTGNDVAAALGLPRRDLGACVRALEAALDRGPRRVDAVRAGTPGDPDPRWYAGVLSCGFDAAVNARANTMTRPRGSARYLRAVAAELGRFVPYGYRLTLDDAVWQSAGTLVAVANAPRFGGGIAIAPDARMDDGLLDVVVAGPFTRRGVAAVLPGAYRGRHVHHPAVRVLRTRSVLVEADPTLGGPPPVAFADGEPLGALPLQVDVQPGALAVLA